MVRLVITLMAGVVWMGKPDVLRDRNYHQAGSVDTSGNSPFYASSAGICLFHFCRRRLHSVYVLLFRSSGFLLSLCNPILKRSLLSTDLDTR